VKRIGIIFGGANSEHEVSCNSARSVVAHLDSTLFEGILIGIDKTGGWHRLESVDALAAATGGSRFPDLEGVDVVFPVLHGRFGEDGTVQGLLELAGIPYVGCGVLASALAMDKFITQRLLDACGIPTIPTRGITLESRDEVSQLASEIEYPVFVKPNRAGSSVGASRVDSPLNLLEAVDLALQHDKTALIQKAISGDEVSLGVLQGPDGSLEVGATLRVRPRTAAFFDYEAKYTEGGADFEVPALLPAAVSEQLVQFAIDAFRALDCEGLARIDFFVGEDGAITLNEINTLPGLTAFSQYPRMWQAVGLSYTDLLSRLIDRAGVVFSS
jgi:D-alanine-D-alanine ligase